LEVAAGSCVGGGGGSGGGAAASQAGGSCTHRPQLNVVVVDTAAVACSPPGAGSTVDVDDRRPRQRRICGSRESVRIRQLAPPSTSTSSWRRDSTSPPLPTPTTACCDVTARDRHTPTSRDALRKRAASHASGRCAEAGFLSRVYTTQPVVRPVATETGRKTDGYTTGCIACKRGLIKEVIHSILEGA